MLVRSVTATTALALIAIVAADRPRIYFPRQVTREFYNSTIPATEITTTPDNVTPGGVETTTTSTTSSKKNVVGEVVSGLLGGKTPGSLSIPKKSPTATHVASSAVDDKGTDGSPKIIGTRTSGKTSSSLTSKPIPDPQDGSKPSTSEDTAIVIAPTGIVAPTSSSSIKTESKGRTASPLQPTSTNIEPVETVPLIGDPPTSAPPKDVIPVVGSSPSSVTSSRRGTPGLVGTGISSTVVPPSSTKLVDLKPLDPVVSNSVVGDPLPAPTSTTVMAETPVRTSFVGTAPESSYIKPDTVVKPTGGVAPVASSKSGTPELTGTSVGAVPETTLKPDTASRSSSPAPVESPTSSPAPVESLTSSPSPVESPTSSLVPIPTSKRPILDPLEPVVSSILPGPSSVNSTAMATESTVPPPIAVLPTGSSPKALLPTESATRPKGTSDSNPTTLSPISSLSPSPSSLLPIGSTTSVGTQSLPDTSSTTSTEVSVSTGSTDGLVSKPTETSFVSKPTQTSLVSEPTETSLVSKPTQTSSATASITDKIPEVPVVNSTTPETATVAPTYSNPPSAPSEIPVVNSTRLADPTSLPTGPVTLPPKTSSTVDKSAQPTYIGPESSSSSSQPSSVSEGTEPSSKPPRPVDSSTAMTTPTRAPPASTAVQTVSKPAQPPPPESPSASPPPSQPTTASTPQPFPTWIPKYFTPNHTDQPPPGDVQNITIGFRDVVSPQYPDDNGATVQFFKSILRALPPILSLSFNSTMTDRIRVSRVEVCNDRPLRNAIALVSFPNDNRMIDNLQIDLELYESPINKAEEVLMKDAKDSRIEMDKALEMIEVIKKIDHTFDIRSKHCRGRGSGQDTAPGGGTGPNNDDGEPRVDTFGNPVPKDGPTRQSAATTGGIVAGAVGFSVMYGAAMFIVARRYKRKKQSHRRSNSVTNSQNSSEMRYTGGASPALMGGALISREYVNYGAGGRDSRGSGRSGMGNSGRTANISAPVAAENSLGWN